LARRASPLPGFFQSVEAGSPLVRTGGQQTAALRGAYNRIKTANRVCLEKKLESCVATVLGLITDVVFALCYHSSGAIQNFADQGLANVAPERVRSGASIHPMAFTLQFAKATVHFIGRNLNAEARPHTDPASADKKSRFIASRMLFIFGWHLYGKGPSHVCSSAAWTLASSINIREG
jgi:hypothetical protein